MLTNSHFMELFGQNLFKPIFSEIVPRISPLFLQFCILFIFRVVELFRVPVSDSPPDSLAIVSVSGFTFWKYVMLKIWKILMKIMFSVSLLWV